MLRNKIEAERKTKLLEAAIKDAEAISKRKGLTLPKWF